MNDAEKITGSNIDIYTDTSGIGTLSKRLVSNATSREALEKAINQLDDVSAKYGVKFKDDIRTQIYLAEQLEKRFSLAPTSSFKGGIRETVQEVANKGPMAAVIDKAMNTITKDITDESALKALNNLIKEAQ